MPTEGEIEKFIKLQKEVGFVGLGLKKASHGKRLDQEAALKAENDPGKLVTPKDLNKMARGRAVDTSEEEDTERTDMATTEREERKANFKEEVKAAAGATGAEEEKKQEEAMDEALGLDKQAQARKRSIFMKRKFERFRDPPRWVMAERCFETQQLYRCKKLWWEDYSSSSDNDDFWGRDVENVLSDDQAND